MPMLLVSGSRSVHILSVIITNDTRNEIIELG